MAGSGFFDSNVLLYLASEDVAKVERAERLLEAGGHVSVQVLNELANVARRKMRLSVDEARDWLGIMRALLQVHPVTEATHDTGMAIAARYGLSTHDSMIIAAAVLAGCGTVYSEDMQHGMQTEMGVRVINPFI